MISISYPPPSFKIKQQQGSDYIFDAIRKIWLLLTEEEWVRQNFVHYLIVVKHYPSTAIAVEKEIKLGDLKKRFDVLIYDAHFQPWMLIECKAPHIILSEEVLQQVLRYNISVPVPYIIITNGNSTIGWQKKDNGLILLSDMPVWSE